MSVVIDINSASVGESLMWLFGEKEILSPFAEGIMVMKILKATTNLKIKP